MVFNVAHAVESDISYPVIMGERFGARDDVFSY